MRFAGLHVRPLPTVGLALGLVLAVRITSAQERSAAAEPPTLVTVRYEAEVPCPGRTVFVGNLVARTRRVQLTEDRPDAVTFAVRIFSEGAVSLGTLEVTNPGRPPTVREVRAETCGEVVEALALVAALTIDPDADTAPLTREAVKVAASSLLALPAAAESAVEAPAEPPADEPAAQSVEPPPQCAPPPSPAPESPPSAGPPGIEVGVGGQLEADEAPFGKPFLGWRGFVDVSPRGNDVMRPSLGVSVAFGSASVESRLGGAELDWVAGRLDLCPVDLARASWASVRPCVAFDVGQVKGAGWDRAEDVHDLDVHNGRFTWASGALLGRADLQPLGPLLIRLEAGVVVPFTSGAGFELRGQAESDTLVAVSSASLVAGTGLGLRFP